MTSAVLSRLRGFDTSSRSRSGSRLGRTKCSNSADRFSGLHWSTAAHEGRVRTLSHALGNRVVLSHSMNNGSWCIDKFLRP
jgi:hypothetical protein